MKRVVLMVVYLFFAFTASAQSVDGLFFDYGATLESELSLGSAAAATRTRPRDSGTDALLTREDLEGAGSASAPQTVLDSSLSIETGLGLRAGDTIVSLAASLLVLQSPGGYREPVWAMIAPAESGLSIRRYPRDWDGATTEVLIGRIRLTDSSASVIDQLVDGAGFAIRFPALFIGAGVGTTRFIDAFEYSPRLAADDGLVFSEDSVFGPERILATIRAEYGPIARQAFGLSLVAYDDRAPGTGVQAFYAGVAAQGIIANFVSHRTDLIFQGVTDSAHAAILVGTTLRASLPGLPLEALAGAHWSSGESGSLSTFRPVTPRPVSEALGVAPGNLLWVDLGASVDLSEANAGRLLRPELGSVLLMTPGADRPWLGFEATAGVSAGLLPGVQLDASGGVAYSPLGWAPVFVMKGRVEL